MTLPEKAAQMVRVPYAYVSREEARDWAKRGAGSFLHVMGDDAREIQQLALGTRLGIPGRFRCITTAYPAGTAGRKTAQVYVRDLVGSVMSPVKRLVAFQKAVLKPRESRELVFSSGGTIFAGACGRNARLEPGDVTLFVGGSSRDADLLSHGITLAKQVNQSE